MRQKITDPKVSLQFILAGQSTVTFKSVKTQRRFTFKVKKLKTRTGPLLHFVSVMNGSDNIYNYMYIGTIYAGETFHHTKNSKIKKTDIRFKAFEFVLGLLLKGQTHPDVEIWHEGRCGKCGRKLTVPESIKTGFGPHCAKLIGVEVTPPDTIQTKINFS